MLHHDIYGDDTDADTLVIAHGLFGAGRNWRAIARRLSAERRVVTVDMRNHGASLHSDAMGYSDMAGDLAGVIDSFGGRVAVLGHSMGGKAAMVLALDAPAKVTRLIVGDIAPVAYTHSQTGNIDAMEAVDLAALERRSDVVAALGAEGLDAGVAPFLAQSADLDAGAWTLNLAALRRSMPDILGFPDSAGRYDGPTLFLCGARSDYVGDAGKVAIRPLFPAARVMALKDAGHWLHADQPRAFIDTVSAFLA